MKTVINIGKLDMSKVIVSMANKEYFAEMLETIAHEYYLDMLVVYKQVLQNDESGFTTRTILNSEIENEGLTMDEFKRIALKNTARMFPAKLNDFCGMKIITNETGNCGASAIMYSNLVEQTAEEMESDIYLIPSSIHEFIVMPAKGLEVSALCQMIHEANNSVVEPKEVLSDHPYIYERTVGQLMVA